MSVACRGCVGVTSRYSASLPPRGFSISNATTCFRSRSQLIHLRGAAAFLPITVFAKVRRLFTSSTLPPVRSRSAYSGVGFGLNVDYGFFRDSASPASATLRRIRSLPTLFGLSARCALWLTCAQVSSLYVDLLRCSTVLLHDIREMGMCYRKRPHFLEFGVI